jgi:hypothetical protein
MTTLDMDDEEDEERRSWDVSGALWTGAERKATKALGLQQVSCVGFFATLTVHLSRNMAAWAQVWAHYDAMTVIVTCCTYCCTPANLSLQRQPHNSGLEGSLKDTAAFLEGLFAASYASQPLEDVAQCYAVSPAGQCPGCLQIVDRGDSDLRIIESTVGEVLMSSGKSRHRHTLGIQLHACLCSDQHKNWWLCCVGAGWLPLGAASSCVCADQSAVGLEGS